MKKNRLGRTELKVSQIVLGGGWVGGLFIDPDLGVMEKALVKAINAGINWIDTAESYSEGQSEKNIGLLLSSIKNNNIYISSKARLEPISSETIFSQLDRKIDESLERLNRSYIDLYQLHNRIEKVGTNEKTLIKDLFETMYHSKGIGLAAVQVGILKRILVIDVSTKDEKKKPMSFINPTIKKISDETSIYEEGCLSIPDTFIEIERPKICEVEYIDINGKIKNLKCDGLLSTCLQHEINHLDGKLIIDHLSKLKRDIIIKKISKTKKNPDRIIV